MKILVFGDTHGDLFSLSEIHERAKDADLVICLGDITVFGSDLYFLLEIINNFPKKVLMMHGNHEFEEEMELACKEFDNIQFTHQEIINADDYDFLTYGGGGFAVQDPIFEQLAPGFIENTRNKNKTILLLHGPPANTKLDIPYDDYHCGNQTVREFIEETQPLLVLAGHIHECEGETDYINDSILHNPGPLGTMIDLKKLEEKRKKKEKIKDLKKE